MIRRTFFKLALGILGALGLPRPITAAVDREAKREEMRRRGQFIDEARAIIARRMVVDRAEIPRFILDQDPLLCSLSPGQDGVRLQDDELVHVMRATFTSNIRGAKLAIAVDTAPLQTVRRFAAAGNFSLEAMRHKNLSLSIARLHWDRRIAVR